MTHSETTAPVSSPGEVTQVVEHFFRHEAGKMISTLTRIFGIENLNRAEDVVQETLAKALQTWPYYGTPSKRRVNSSPAGISNAMRASRILCLARVNRL